MFSESCNNRHREPLIASGIGDNATGISENATEIGDNATVTVDIAAKVIK